MSIIGKLIRFTAAFPEPVFVTAAVTAISAGCLTLATAEFKRFETENDIEPQ